MGELEFWAAMYLESVCDETRAEFLKKWRGAADGSDDKIQQFKKKIELAPYSDLMEELRKLTAAEKVVMFQSKDQGSLADKKVEYRDIIVLARTNDLKNKINILRSELLEFYRNQDHSQGRPASVMLLDITDTVRIVRVDEQQQDLSVQSYQRTPCTIAYVRLDYIDQLNEGKTGHIFFAFFYPIKQSKSLLSILKYLQGFLSFRHSLKLRIEKDFNGNLFGKRTEELWRIDWLSIEKAGAHTDSSNVNRLISGRSEQTDILDTLFSAGKGSDKDSGQLLKLTYNIMIAMYYRAVISDDRKQFIAADNIEKGDESSSYFKVQDLIKFSEQKLSDITIGFGCGQSANDINNAYVYGAASVPTLDDGRKTGGIPQVKEVTFRCKYLRAFLVDILCNIETHGKSNTQASIYIEDLQAEGPKYLVFQNQVDAPSSNPAAWCQEKNYMLKQSIEFDHVDTMIPKGISLGCIAHCVQWAGRFVVSYTHDNGKTYYTIKLPIIRKEEGTSDGKTADH